MFILIWYNCVIIGMIVLKKIIYICSFFKKLYKFEMDYSICYDNGFEYF